ncbi:alpha/beta hydrolase [soil metagenome]
MKKTLRKFRIYHLVILLLVWILIGYVFSNAVTSAKQSGYSALLQIETFPVNQLKLKSSDGVNINAWLAGTNKKDVVILLAGIGANSSFMTDRAALYLKKGFSVLLPDLRATGKSEGKYISFGWNERLDLISCYRWLHENGYENIAAHGCSLGAATIAYSFDSIHDYSFVVMESSYDNIDHAFAHRTFDSGFNRFLFWPAYFFTEQKINVAADLLSPENRMHLYKGPVLYLSGDKEKQIRPQEMWNIFRSSGSLRKFLHIFKGAEHEDFLIYNAPVYRSILSSFLFSINGKS